MAAPLPAGAVRPRSSRLRPTTPTATAPTPTAPARIMNERRDQSGISATGPAVRRRVRGGAPERTRREASRGPTGRPRPTLPSRSRRSPASRADRRARRGTRRRRRRRTRRRRPMYRRRATTPSTAPRTSATTTMNSSRASLSFVPNRATTKSLAPGGWRSMTTWPTAATSDVAPASRPASSSETPSAAAVATIPATGAAQSRRAGRRRVADGRAGDVGGGAHPPIIAVRCDVRVSTSGPRRARPATRP